MYTLIIGKSKSSNFKRAVDLAILLGGNYDGDKITLTIDEEMKAYETFFPLFRLNVLNWVNTRAYHNGTMVDPYRFMFLMHLKRRSFFADVLEQLNGDLLKYLFSDRNTAPFLYHKREGNLFFFQGHKKEFSLKLEGQRLYEFVDKYDVGDIVYFE